MAKRVQVQSGIDRGEITPQAQAVDQFVRPFIEQAPQTNTAERLADALKDINPQLNKFLTAEQDRINAEDEAEGERLFKQNSGFDWDKAVKAGQVPAGASPNVRRGYKRSELRNRMYAFGTAMRTAYAESPISESDDPEELQDFMQKFSAEWMGENLGDGEFTDLMLQGTAFPIIERTQGELGQRHVESRVKFVETALVENLSGEIHTLIDNKVEQGEDELNLDDLGGFVSAIGEDYVSKGVSGAALNQAVVDSIVLKARQEGDPEILGLLDRVKTGTGVLGQTRYARDQREKAESFLANEEVRMEKLSVWRREKQRTDIVRRGNTAAIQALIEDPFVDLTPLVGKMASVDPDAARTLMTFQNTRQNVQVDVKEFAPEIAALYDVISNAPDEGAAQLAIMQAANEGAISPNTVESMFRFAERNESNAGLYGSRWYKDLEGDLVRTIKGNDFNETSTRVFLSRRAKVELREDIADWIESNSTEDGGYSTSALKKFANAQYEVLVTNPRFGVSDDIASDLSFMDPDTATTPPPVENQPNSEPSAPDNPFESEDMFTVQ